MSFLAKLLDASRLTSIVDVGANPIDGDPPYKDMLSAGLATLIGFEPQEHALKKLQENKGSNELYLPYVIGNGLDANLNICRDSGMTSLLEPDSLKMNLFDVFKGLGDVVHQLKVSTKRLDDVNEISHIDLLKIDIQGSELSVFQHAKNKLRDAVAVQTEVSFITLYKNQPSIGDVDLELRKQGFIPHGFFGLKKLPISPCVFNGDPRVGLNQLVEADILYVRDFSQFHNLSDDQIKHLALVAHHCYDSYDLVLKCLVSLEARGQLDRNAQNLYMQSLVNG